MSAYAETSVVARKRHTCEEYADTHPIEPGETYVRAVAFPDGDVNTGTAPWVMKLCARHFTGTTGRSMPPRRSTNPPDPERAICDHRFPDGTLCKLTRVAHEDVPGLAALHAYPPGPSQ